MTSFQKARYALWNHASTQMSSALEWRETPKSKDLVSVVPPTVLPGVVLVHQIQHDAVEVRLTTTQQQEAMQVWISNLPDYVIRPSVQETSILRSSGNFVCYDNKFRATDVLPSVGSHVRVRLHCSVSRIGAMRKTQIVVTDVLHAGITA